MQILSDWFLWAILAVVAIASFFPHLSATLHANQVSDYGIFAIFFLYGVNLSVESLRTGLVNWRLHLLVQLSTFVLFPALFIPFRTLCGPWLPPDLQLGFFYLCALPSTISSSVAMTAIARGNVPAAIFNATLSSLLGVFITPALVSLVAQTTGQAPPLAQTVTKVATLLLLPFTTQPRWQDRNAAARRPPLRQARQRRGPAARRRPIHRLAPCGQDHNGPGCRRRSPAR